MLARLATNMDNMYTIEFIDFDAKDWTMNVVRKMVEFIESNCVLSNAEIWSNEDLLDLLATHKTETTFVVIDSNNRIYFNFSTGLVKVNISKSVKEHTMEVKVNGMLRYVLNFEKVFEHSSSTI